MCAIAIFYYLVLNNKMYMKDIGRRIRYFRQKLDLSQFELSQRSNVSQTSIARIEANKQKNFKRETIEKLAYGLDVSLSQLMEEHEMIIKEDKAIYPRIRMVPLIKISAIEDIKEFFTLTKKADILEPSFSADMKAFYLRVTDDLLIGSIIDKGDLLLIEPTVQIKEGDIVLYLSNEQTVIGKIYYGNPDICILQPLRQELSPIAFSKKDRKRLGIKTFRVSEIKKKALIP